MSPEWVASEDPPATQTDSTDRVVSPEAVQRVIRARWCKPALVSHDRRERVLIDTDQ